MSLVDSQFVGEFPHSCQQVSMHWLAYHIQQTVFHMPTSHTKLLFKKLLILFTNLSTLALQHHTLHYTHAHAHTHTQSLCLVVSHVTLT